MWFLADDIDNQSRYVWADSWEEAHLICDEEGFELVGEYIATYPTDIVD